MHHPDPQQDNTTDDSLILDAIEADDPVAVYLREIGPIPLLTHDEEIELAQRIEQGRLAMQKLQKDDLDTSQRDELQALVEDSIAARNQLVHANTRLVISVAKKYANYGVDFLDLIQEGNIGLIRAAEAFDHQRGVKFSTYATYWITQFILRAIGNQSRSIRIPINASAQISRLNRAAQLLIQELGREPTVEELAEETEIPAKRISQLLDWDHRPVSLDILVNDDEDSFVDTVEDTSVISPQDAVVARDLQETVAKLLDELPPRDARVLRYYYGLEDGQSHTLEEIGGKLGVTRERARQLVSEALRRCRNPRRRRRLQGFL